MGIVLKFGSHSAASETVRRNESIGRPVSSLSRLASSSDALLRPARMLRRCGTEQPTRSASAKAAASSGMNGANGCSDMAVNISTRNALCQPERFLSEMVSGTNALVCSVMAKVRKASPRTNYLGAWIDLLGPKLKDVAEAAHVTPSYVSNICRNDGKKPSIDVMLAISEFLDVPLNDLYKPPPAKASVAALGDYLQRTRETLLKKVGRSR
jgi:Helix-turn-helix